MGIVSDDNLTNVIRTGGRNIVNPAVLGRIDPWRLMGLINTFYLTVLGRTVPGLAPYAMPMVTTELT